MRSSVLYGLIGKPLAGSFSRGYFTRLFEDGGIDAHYDNFELSSIAELPRLLNTNPHLRGFNVTSPYKEEVIAYLDALDPAAAEIEAVNCVRIEEGRLTGYNTDAPGFRDALVQMIGTSRPNALLLGTGGASKAVAHALRGLGIQYVTVSRSVGRGGITYADITPEVVACHQLIINATPLGMAAYEGKCPPIELSAVTSSHILYDLIYNPSETEFLRRGRLRGAQTQNGYAMLIRQAELSWEIWNDR